MAISYYELVERLQEFLHDNPNLKDLPVVIDDLDNENILQLLSVTLDTVDKCNTRCVRLSTESMLGDDIAPPLFNHNC